MNVLRKELDSKLADSLAKQGWFPEWSYDVESVARKIKKMYELDITDVPWEFLSRFGGLSLSDRSGHRTYLNPLRMKRFIPTGGAPWDDHFFPIGEVEGGQAILLMDNEGRVWFYADGDFTRLADSPDQALKCFVEKLF